MESMREKRWTRARVIIVVGVSFVTDADEEAAFWRRARRWDSSSSSDDDKIVVVSVKEDWEGVVSSWLQKGWRMESSSSVPLAIMSAGRLIPTMTWACDGCCRLRFGLQKWLKRARIWVSDTGIR